MMTIACNAASVFAAAGTLRTAASNGVCGRNFGSDELASRNLGSDFAWSLRPLSQRPSLSQGEPSPFRLAIYGRRIQPTRGRKGGKNEYARFNCISVSITRRGYYQATLRQMGTSDRVLPQQAGAVPPWHHCYVDYWSCSSSCAALPVWQRNVCDLIATTFSLTA